jgi:hypothetical protein
VGWDSGKELYGEIFYEDTHKRRLDSLDKGERFEDKVRQ